MSSLSTKMARTALRAALDVRRKGAVSREAPVNIFDMSEKLGIEVKFAGSNSFGGMWVKQSKTILVPSLRPAGRQSFTCAHELGHWHFDHGTKVDLLDDQEISASNEDEEILVNAFAGFILMPPWAIERAFRRRGWNLQTCNPIHAFSISCQMGVSYEALITHLCNSLRLITRSHADALFSVSPKEIREEMLHGARVARLVIVDCNWESVPIDLQVGEMALVAIDITLSGNSVKIVDKLPRGVVIEAITPGIGRLQADSLEWATFVRVCRKDFEGRSCYRHMEDPQPDD